MKAKQLHNLKHHKFMSKKKVTKEVNETVSSEEKPVIAKAVQKEEKPVEPSDTETANIPAETKEEPAAPVVEKEPFVPAYRAEADKNLPFSDRIVAYLKSRGATGYVKLNDFLKSLYPLPVANQAPEWASQGASKFLKMTLHNMEQDGLLQINNAQHKRLGTLYYSGDSPVTQYHNIITVPIEAKL